MFLAINCRCRSSTLRTSFASLGSLCVLDSIAPYRTFLLLPVFASAARSFNAACAALDVPTSRMPQVPTSGWGQRLRAMESPLAPIAALPLKGRVTAMHLRPGWVHPEVLRVLSIKASAPAPTTPAPQSPAATSPQSPAGRRTCQPSRPSHARSAPGAWPIAS